MAAILYALMLQTGYPGPENWAYVQCLIAEAGSATGLSQTGFDARLAAACPVQAQAIRSRIVETEEARGLSHGAAERRADDYFAAVRQSMRDLRPVR